MRTGFYPALCAVFFIHLSSFAQIDVQWVARYTTAGNNIDRAKAMVLDTAKRSYVVGTSWNGSNFDIVTTKFSPTGTFVWSASYNGPGNAYDEARAIAVDNSGNVYVTGYSAGAGNNYDVVTIKYNSAGAQQWASRYNGSASGFDEGYDIAVDTAGNVYVTGGATTTAGGQDYVTIKYNSAGAQQWATVYNNSGTNPDEAYAITLDRNANVYVTGYSFGNAASDADVVTIKYNNAGAQQWLKRYNGPGSVFDAGTDIVTDASANVYVCGYVRDTVGTTNYSYVTIKYNSAGTQQWLKIYDGPGHDDDEANAIALTRAGNVVVTGRSLGTPATAEDIATLLYDGTTGNNIWTRRYDGHAVNYDEGYAIATDSSNRVFISGYSYAAASNNDYLTIKYGATGDTSWVVKYNGPGNNSDQGYSVAIDSTGDIFVGGMSKGAGTNEDYAVVKYCQLTAIGSNDTSICLGANVQLSAQSSYGGMDSVWWTPSTGLSQSNVANPVASPTVTTNYTLHVRNLYGCVDLDTVTVTVYPLPGPAITASGPTSFCIGDSVMLTANDTTGGNVSYSWNTGDTTQSITVNTSGNYIVTMTSGSNCSSQSQISVTVHPLPNISAGSDTGMCTSTNITLCATGGVSYAWTPSASVSDSTIACPTIGPTSSTTYIVYGTDAFGCKNSDTVVVTVYPPPSTPVVTENNGVLTSTAAVTYQWYFNSNPINGATSQNYTPTVDGQYYVVITDSHGCTAFSSTITVSDVGIKKYALNENLALFPNPNNGTFTLSLDQLGESAQLDIFDVTGQVIFTQAFPAAHENKMDFSLGADRGVYFVQVTLADGTRMTTQMILQ